MASNSLPFSRSEAAQMRLDKKKGKVTYSYVNDFRVAEHCVRYSSLTGLLPSGPEPTGSQAKRALKTCITSTPPGLLSLRSMRSKNPAAPQGFQMPTDACSVWADSNRPQPIRSRHRARQGRGGRNYWCAD